MFARRRTRIRSPLLGDLGLIWAKFGHYFYFSGKNKLSCQKKILESINTHRVCALCCFDYGHAKRLSGSSRQSAPDGHGPRQYK